MKFIDLGLKDYNEVWTFQRSLFEKAVSAKQKNEQAENILLFCEHPHTITLGKNAQGENVLLTSDLLAQKEISIYNIDRGGDVTYHGPGQLVVYPIFDLETFKIGLRQYIWNLEEVVIRFLSLYNIVGQRSEGATGVWLGIEDPLRMRKIAAIGVRCSRYITMHGLALNLSTDLSYFSLINPCGFADKGVTSLEKELESKIDMELAKRQFREIFNQLFSIP